MVELALVLLLIGGQSQDPAAVTRDLTEIEQQLGKSWKNGDCDGWGASIAPEWSVIHVNGAALTKVQALQMCKSAQTTIDVLTIDEVSVRVFGDAAVVTGRTTITTSRQNPLTVRLRFTDVFVRRAGRWQIVASQATQLATRAEARASDAQA